MNSQQFFLMAFVHRDIPHISFNNLWKNSIGYFIYAVKGKHAPKLKNNETIKSIDTNGNKVVMVGTRDGNIVLFERYKDDYNKMIVCNYPSIPHESITNYFQSMFNKCNDIEIIEDVVTKDFFSLVF